MSLEDFMKRLFGRDKPKQEEAGSPEKNPQEDVVSLPMTQEEKEVVVAAVVSVAAGDQPDSEFIVKKIIRTK